MKVLVACEFSGMVRDAFARRGHDAWSCDLLPTEVPGNHYQCDVREVIDMGWDLMVAHPPCTHLCSSGARWWKGKKREQKESLQFFLFLLNAPVPMIAVENPVGLPGSRICKPTQIIQPWMFGHGETKTTCLWLKNLPPLRPTRVVEGRESRCHRMSQSKNRWKKRSITYQGVARAMASQWTKKTVVGFDLHVPFKLRSAK